MTEAISPFPHPPVVDARTAGELGSSASSGSTAVIVTFNSAKTIGDCLHSVLLSLHEGDEVIIVDNASSDDTVAEVERFLPLTRRLRLIRNEENLGFSLGCNIGLRHSRSEYLVLLNPDTTVPPRWLEKLRRAFSEGVGAVGPVSDNAGSAHGLDRYLPPGIPLLELQDILTELYSGQTVETKLLIGFCMMLKRDILNSIGLLDEDLFLGNDDLEISWRLRSHGLKLLVAKDVFVHHINHVSFASVGPAVVEQYIQESSAALDRKLKRYFGDQMPSAEELWGVTFQG